MKTLQSGLVVDEEQYYKLLEWKDNNMHEYITFCTNNACSYSINKMNKEQYDTLLKFAKISK